MGAGPPWLAVIRRIILSAALVSLLVVLACQAIFLFVVLADDVSPHGESLIYIMSLPERILYYITYSYLLALPFAIGVGFPTFWLYYPRPTSDGLYVRAIIIALALFLFTGLLYQFGSAPLRNIVHEQ